jgi:2-hydroxychromene-2-carboxylate isomerase
VFKATGQGPLLDVPLKGDYAQRDLARRARRLGLPFRLPSPFPFRAQAPARAYYVVADSDPAAARDLARRLYAAAFGEGRDISWPAAVAQVAAEAGHDGAALADAIARPPAKQRLRAETDAAIAAGVFGSPFLRVDGEPFWGADRLREAADWLAEGGW